MLKNKIELVIFDCDGTLVDSEKINNAAISSVLLELGHQKFTLDYCINFFAGCSIYDLKNTLNHLKEKNIEKILETIQTRAEINAEHYLMPVNNVINTISQIKLPICVVSNGQREMVLDYIKITKLNQFFPKKNIFTRELVLNPKPSPDLYLYAAKSMGNYDPATCLVIEDSIVGVTAGYKAGMNVIGFTGANYQHHKMHRLLLDAGAFTVTTNMKTVLKYL
jgi:phosphoglycolate phosphatase